MGKSITHNLHKSITFVGSYYVLELSNSLDAGISYISFKDSISGLSTTNAISRQASYRVNGEWSPWMSFDDIKQLIMGLSEPIWLKFKWSITSNLEDTSVIIESLLVDYEGGECCEKEGPSLGPLLINTTCLPVDDSMFGMYADISNQMDEYVNGYFGVPCCYIKAEYGDGDIDAIIHEWHRGELNQYKELRVVIEGNKLPDIKPQFSEWGIEFDNFDVQVSKPYFDRFFPDARPTRGDILIFTVFNRIYAVSGVYLDRGVMGKDSSYTLSLRKYEDESYLEKSEAVEELLSDITLKDEDFFKEIVGDEMNATSGNAIKPAAIGYDEMRSYIAQGVSIIPERATNNGNDWINGYYLLSSLEDTVSYVKPIDEGSLGLAMLYRQAGASGEYEVASIAADGPNALVTFTTSLPLSLRKVAKSILLGDAVYDISEVGASSVSISSYDTGQEQPVTAIIGTANTLLSSDNLSVVNIGDQFIIRYSGQAFVFGVPIPEDWVGLIVNCSQQFKCVTARLYVRSSQEGLPDPKAHMDALYSKDWVIVPNPNLGKSTLTLGGGSFMASNVQAWASPIPAENSQRILSSRYINGGYKLLFYDGANPLMNFDKLSTNKSL